MDSHLKNQIAGKGEQFNPYAEDLLCLWSDVFGKNVRSAIEKPDFALKVIVDRGQAILNRFNERSGELCVFLRNPVTDRLILERSTVPLLNPGADPPPTKFFEKIDQNYDLCSRKAYYDLFDRLASDSEKRSDSSRRNRGFTGWVAVTGHPLLVNTREDLLYVESLPCINSEIQKSCLIYGKPLWGNRVSEFLFEDTSSWCKHYLAVPIKSLNDKSITIGVLRYACGLEEDFLGASEKWALEWIAQIITNVKYLAYEKSIHDRNASLPHEVTALRKNGDISKFLNFAAKSLRSEIASVYLSISESGEQKVRLLEACGISGNVGELRGRGQIEDYGLNKRGFTWKLHESFRNRVKGYGSVGEVPEWTGRNTVVFYEHVLAKLGIAGIAELLSHTAKRCELVRSYSIKIIGMGLEENGVPIGVIKVEFPSDFDSSLHYNDEDSEFFQNCAEALKEELKKYLELINGKWFERKNGGNVEEFVRVMSRILQSKLISKELHPIFWKKARRYSKAHKDAIQNLNPCILRELNIADGKWVKRIKLLAVKTIKGLIKYGWEFFGKGQS